MRLHRLHRRPSCRAYGGQLEQSDVGVHVLWHSLRSSLSTCFAQDSRHAGYRPYQLCTLRQLADRAEAYVVRRKETRVDGIVYSDKAGGFNHRVRAINDSRGVTSSTRKQESCHVQQRFLVSARRRRAGSGTPCLSGQPITTGVQLKMKPGSFPVLLAHTRGLTPSRGTASFP